MRRLLPRSPLSRLLLLTQLVCVAAGSVVLIALHQEISTRALQLIVPLAGGVWVVTLTGWRIAMRGEERAASLARNVAEERELTATLEHAVSNRTRELEDAQRVLKRMWQLGQHVALELNPQRVLERFLETVTDIARADGAAVGLLTEDGKLRIAAATGAASGVVGMSVPSTNSAMSRVARTGTLWAVSNVQNHFHEIDTQIYEGIGDYKGLAIVPLARRGERIGAVAIVAREERIFSSADLERIEALADLLSVSLENAELVETLRQTEWRFRTLFRSAPDAVFTVLESGRIREANDAVRDVTAVDPQQVVGRSLGELVVADDRERLRAVLRGSFDGRPGRIEVSFAPGDGQAATPRLVSLAMTKLPEADPATVLIIGRDITGEREMRQRLMESDRLAAVGELVAGVAHEVNNPLSSISAFAQLLLRDDGLSSPQRDSIEVIRSETTRASYVVKDLLAFARRSEPRREPVDVNSVVERTLRLRSYQFAASRVTVETRLGDDLPAVLGDARQLQQVCLNLVTNAAQAMASRGGGVLTIVTRAESDGREVALEVSDTGPGIPESVRARIFEPFFTTKAEGEGTGLGLSVSYGIVGTHGGTIAIASSSPAGTTFRVTIPALDSVSPAADLSIADSTPRRTLVGRSVLFVDDEAALRDGVEAFGAVRGFTVLTAKDGAQGLDLIRRASVDAVVCDLRMPGMDGPTFHAALQREAPILAARTVFVTGDVVSATARQASRRQPILTKPFALETLEATIAALLEGPPGAQAAN
jgi:PAS domain S-box-containing protein